MFHWGKKNHGEKTIKKKKVNLRLRHNPIPLDTYRNSMALYSNLLFCLIRKLIQIH